MAIFFIFVLSCSAILLISWRDPALYQLEILVLYLLYMSVAFTFLPLPTAWIVLWAAREVEPLSVALIGTIGTCIANLHDYYIIHYLFRIERIKRAKQARFYKKAVQWFNRAPFITLSTASFLPIPIDVVRILAVSTDYPRHLFTLANFTGRFPRYLLFAYLGYQMQLSNRAIFIVLIVTVVIGALNGLSKLYQKYRRKLGKNDTTN
ncbi:MAG: hypothetical protein GQ561_02415 [Calditrichae bacterium]|nr:hypothetical protein [Calditrichia bacterium]